jgi:hypothetical protein
MEDARRDVGIIGRGLSPTDRARVRGDAHKADELVGEGLEFLYRNHAIAAPVEADAILIEHGCGGVPDEMKL